MPKQEECYIAGGMRGYPRFQFDAFDSLAHWLRRNRKWQVHNPAEHDREQWPDIETWDGFKDGDTDRCPQFDLTMALSWDLARVAESQHLVLLPGWEQSTGARHERHVAELTGSSIWLAKAFQPGGNNEWRLELDMNRDESVPAGPDIDSPTGRRPGSLQPTPTPVTAFASSLHYMPDPYKAQAHDTFLGKPITDLSFQGHAFTTKDSGVRAQYASGMVRDTDDGKPRYDLIPLMPLRRLAELYARGAVKYGDFNWQKANSDEELQRMKASAFRHLVQWLDGERDEDHAIGAVWNIFASLWLEEKLSALFPSSASWEAKHDG